MPVSLDEFPLHQIPLSMAYVGSSDRNFYDRYYFNAHDRTGDMFLVTGLGVYPNLGVIDAFCALRHGTSQHTARFSGALNEDRLHPAVGPYRIEVIEPLQKIRLVCNHEPASVEFDLTWQGSFPAIEEQPHRIRQGPRTILEACRFAQVGTWSGTIQMAGSSFEVTPDVWVGTRDRSWGIRPIGEPDPPGRWAAEGFEGFWWLYVPLRFEDFSVIVIVQEEPDGYRTLNDAVRVWPDGRIEQLGWPRVTISYSSGTRHPLSAVLELTDGRGKPISIRIDTLGLLALNVGTGYGGDPEWSHGKWMGSSWSDSSTYDLSDPEISGRLSFGVIDHVGHATLSSSGEPEIDGWGMFEHATIGRHDPTGFTDLFSVAP